MAPFIHMSKPEFSDIYFDRFESRTSSPVQIGKGLSSNVDESLFLTTLLLHNENLSRFIKLIQTTAGLDKILRTIQFIARFLAFHITYTNSFVAVRKQFSLSRKLLKLGGNIENARALSDVIYGNDDGVKRWTGIVKHSALSIFGCLDGSLYFPGAGIFTIHNKRRIERSADMLYATALIATMVNGIYRLSVIKELTSAHVRSMAVQSPSVEGTLPSIDMLPFIDAPLTPPITPETRPSLAILKKHVSFDASAGPSPPDSPMQSGFIHDVPPFDTQISQHFVTPLPSPPDSPVLSDIKPFSSIPATPVTVVVGPTKAQKEIAKLDIERKSVLQEVISAGCDVLFPLAGLGVPGFRDVNDGYLGIAGCVSSFIGLRKVWNATRA